MIKLAQTIDRFIKIIGESISWLTGLMVLTTVIIIILRSGLDLGWIWLQETVNWMHASIFMLGSAWTLQADKHVRVDIFYSRFSKRQKALVDFLGSLLLLLPVCMFIAWISFDYVARSWEISEASRESGGLPALYLFKSLILAFAALMVFQGFAKMIRSSINLMEKPS